MEQNASGVELSGSAEEERYTAAEATRLIADQSRRQQLFNNLYGYVLQGLISREGIYIDLARVEELTRKVVTFNLSPRK